MIRITDLNVRFKTENDWFHAVQNVNFTLERGEVIGIVGESGSGKSVTSLAIMRLHNPAVTEITGKIEVEGKNLLELPEAEMRTYRGNKISMIFQEPMTSLNPVLTCGFQVAEAIRIHTGADKKTARLHTLELFREVQLPRPEHIFDSYPHQLSGGQKQRVMIAMALSCNPEVLIADEPTTALDVTVQKTILELLMRIKNERHMSLIFISHDLGVIAEIADRVIVMYKGKVVEQASVAAIFKSPEHPYTQGLLACRPSPDLKLKKLPVVSDFLNYDADGTMQSSSQSISTLLQSLEYASDEVIARRAHLQDQAPLLEVVDLHTWFPVRSGFLKPVTNFVKAVDGVSFDVYPRETLGLVGESGCGKTTLGRSILRLIEPTGGELRFQNTDLRKLNKEELRSIRKDIQIIFQDPYSSLNPRITIGQSIIEPMEVHGIFKNTQQRKERAMELLRRVNLREEHYNRYPHEFSGGQRQRISIARALGLQPKLIICDESVSALDVSVQAQVLNLLKELQDEFGLSYIFISHDLAVVKHISDRMLVMNQGKIVEMGDPDQIYTNPKDEYTQKLIASIPKGITSTV